MLVKLTAKGQAPQQDVPQVMIRFEEQMLKDISGVEWAFLMRLFKQMLNNLEDSPPAS